MMRKRFRLACRSITRHWGMFLLFLVQVICIFLGGNVLLASVQQQAVLEEPYLPYLQQDGYYLPYTPNSILFNQDNLLDLLHGDISTFNFKSYHGTLDSGTPFRIVIYDNSFWDSYHPVLLRGKWEQTVKHQNEAWAIVSPNYTSQKLTIPNAASEIQVVGVLGELSYFPDMNHWRLTGSMTDNLYSVYDIEREEGILLLMPQSSWDYLRIQDEDHVFSDSNCIAVWNQPLTEMEIQENMDILRTHGDPAIPLSTLLERAESAKNENIRKYLPLLIAQIIITVFGLICAAIIQSMQDQHIIHIYSICGMNHRQWIALEIVKYGILLGIAAFVTLMLYLFGEHAHIYAKYGLLFSSENIILTGFMIAGLLLCSALIPFIWIRKQFRTNRRNAE